MSSEEFLATFIPYEILQEMQQRLIANKIFEVTSVPQVADKVAGMVPPAVGPGPSLDKDAAEASSIQRLWTDLITKRTIRGDCGSVAQLECSLLRSVGISPLYGRYYENSKNRFVGHVFSAYYESSERVYRTNSPQELALGTIGTGYCKYPWDNFKTEKGTTEIEAYSPAHSKWFTVNPANVYSLGVPGGYVFRQFKPRFTPEGQ
jgi:O-acetyl-ADP-ribose deacetylase (regulator of RNase III)